MCELGVLIRCLNWFSTADVRVYPPFSAGANIRSPLEYSTTPEVSSRL